GTRVVFSFGSEIDTDTIYGTDARRIALDSTGNLFEPRWLSTPGPANSVAPSITGATQPGQTLTAAPGTWSGSPSFTYQWLRCSDTMTCTNITDATASTYELTDADAPSDIRVLVTATASGATASKFSAPTHVAAVPLQNTALPTISQFV